MSIDTTMRGGGASFDSGTSDAADVVATFRAIGDAQVKSRYRSSYARLQKVWQEDERTAWF